MSQALVLDDCGVANPLILVEDAVGKRDTRGADFQAAIWEVVNVYILALKSFGESGSFKNDPIAVVRQGQLASNVPLLPVAQDIRSAYRPGSIEAGVDLRDGRKRLQTDH